MKISMVVLVTLICGLFAGCSQEGAIAEQRNGIRAKAVDACVELGGVPVIGFWSGLVNDCIFPPKRRTDE